MGSNAEYVPTEYQNARLIIQFIEGDLTNDNIDEVLGRVAKTIKEGSGNAFLTKREGDKVIYSVSYAINWSVTNKTVCMECGEVGKWKKVSKTESSEGENAYECLNCGKVDVF